MAAQKTDYNMGPFRIFPRGEYDSTVRYNYLDTVYYEGSSYMFIFTDTESDLCIGVPPAGDASSELYWQIMAAKGDTGPAAETYKGFLTVTDGTWDYSTTDKIIVPGTAASNSLSISNVYDGCCGMILSPLDLTLPNNSMYSFDYNYINRLNPTQLYMYTFVYYGAADTPLGPNKFIWNRTVVNS